MNPNRTVKLIEIPLGAGNGDLWNRLHSEREEICEALIRDCGVNADDRKEWLRARLRRVDDALDRLMSNH